MSSPAEHLGEEILRLAAGRAVADGHDGQLVLADQIDRLLLGLFLPAGLAADQVDHVVAEHVAELVERRQLAAALEARIDRQHAAVVDRRLQEQIAEIAGKNAHGVRLGPIGQFAAGLALQGGQDQAAEGVAGAAAQIVGMRMPGRHEHLIQGRIHGLHVGTRSSRGEPSPARPRLIANTRCGGIFSMSSAIVEVIAEGLDAALLDFPFLGVLLVLLLRLGPLSVSQSPGSRRSTEGLLSLGDPGSPAGGGEASPAGLLAVDWASGLTLAPDSEVAPDSGSCPRLGSRPGSEVALGSEVAPGSEVAVCTCSTTTGSAAADGSDGCGKEAAAARSGITSATVTAATGGASAGTIRTCRRLNRSRRLDCGGLLICSDFLARGGALARGSAPLAAAPRQPCFLRSRGD